MRLGSLLACLLFAASVCGQPGWPESVPLPVGLKAYTPTNLVQRIAVTDGRPSHRWYRLDQHDIFSNAPTLFNPNVKAPWRVSGGMEGLAGWKSVKMTNVAKDKVSVRRANIPIAGSGRALPGFRWTYPDGAIFADLLVNAAGKPFELRVREKIDGRWMSSVAFEDAEAAPKGYRGAGRCAECHSHAGDSQQYGILIRGNDQVFSFNPLGQ